MIVNYYKNGQLLTVSTWSQDYKLYQLQHSPNINKISQRRHKEIEEKADEYITAYKLNGRISLRELIKIIGNRYCCVQGGKICTFGSTYSNQFPDQQNLIDYLYNDMKHFCKACSEHWPDDNDLNKIYDLINPLIIDVDDRAVYKTRVTASGNFCNESTPTYKLAKSTVINTVDQWFVK